MRVLIIAAAALGAVLFTATCYRPSISNCQYECATGATPCPDGLSCNPDHYCVATKDVTMSCGQLVGDARPPAPDAPCLWSYLPSNLGSAHPDACSFGTSTLSLEIGASTVTVDITGAIVTVTPSNAIPASAFSTVAQSGGAPDVVVLNLAALTILQTGSLTIHGTLPLIILVSGTASIAGPVSFMASNTGVVLCSSGAITDGQSVGFGAGAGGGGGGGGGYGEVGASGGGGSSSASGSAGGAPGMAGAMDSGTTLTPLRFGCPGGFGGRGGSMTAIFGGAGGGALQISAQTRIEISGPIAANGAGGKSLSTLNDGAGGGGTGGSILLEAPGIDFAPTGFLCANGGGGGASGNGGTAGDNGFCNFNAAAGGTSTSTSASGTGGKGGAGSGNPAGAGTAGLSSGGGGGGGGGGVGRIRIRTHGPATGTSGLSSPPYAGDAL